MENPAVELYLIRHGETDYNLKGIIQGAGVDSELNEKGHAQARAFYKHYQHLNFDAVYCSRLQRTAQTLAPWKEAGYELTVTAALDEINWGVLEGKAATKELHERYKDMVGKWQAGELDLAIEEGESPLEVWQRAEPFFNQLIQSPPGKRILLCSHGRSSRIFLSRLLHQDGTQMHQFPHHNTGLNLLQVSANGEISASLLNDLSHWQPS